MKFVFYIVLLFVAIETNAQLKVSVFVSDENNAPLSNVDVSIAGLEAAPFTTKSNGNVTLEINESKYKIGSSVTFIIDKTGYIIDSPVNLAQNLPNENNTNPLKFVLRKTEKSNYITIKGVIQDRFSKPISSTDIEILETGSRTKSNENGVFTFWIKKDWIGKDIKFLINKSGYLFRSERFLAGEKYVVLNDRNVLEIFGENIPSNQSSLIPVAKVSESLSSPELENLFKNAGSSSEWFQNSKHLKIESDDFRSNAEIENIQLTRKYNSNFHQKSNDFGFGWIHNYEQQIDLENSSLCQIVFRNLRGNEMIFYPSVDCGFLIENNLTDYEDMSLKEILEIEREEGRSVLLALNKYEFIGASQYDVVRLKIIPRGFQISYSGNTHHIFNREGRIELIESAGKEPIKILYGLNSKINYVTQGDKYMEFEYNGLGRIIRISYEEGTNFSYFYNSQGFLKEVTKNDNEVHNYSYDNNGMLNNISSKVNEDLEKRDIVYSQDGSLKEISESNNSIQFTFIDSPDISKVIQVFNKEDYRDSEIRKDTIVYEFNNNTQEIIMKRENWNLPKKYLVTPCGCRPLQVIQGSDTTKYEYTRQGLLSKFISKRKFVEISYDEKLFKMTSALVKSNQTDTLEYTTFKYDKNGNLIYAIDFRGQSVELKYDALGKIVEMTNTSASTEKKENTTLLFTYNEIGKPIIIKSEHGKINVEYDESGEISKVESESGHSMALKVTQSFQTLLSIVKPTGISDLYDTDFVLIDSTNPK